MGLLIWEPLKGDLVKNGLGLAHGPLTKLTPLSVVMIE